MPDIIPTTILIATTTSASFTNTLIFALKKFNPNFIASVFEKEWEGAGFDCLEACATGEEFWFDEVEFLSTVYSISEKNGVVKQNLSGFDCGKSN
ncbi:MAG: hypothetical protein AAB609_01325 [Patescibacteria group bacterium]